MLSNTPTVLLMHVRSSMVSVSRRKSKHLPLTWEPEQACGADVGSHAIVGT